MRTWLKNTRTRLETQWNKHVGSGGMHTMNKMAATTWVICFVLTCGSWAMFTVNEPYALGLFVWFCLIVGIVFGWVIYYSARPVWMLVLELLLIYSWAQNNAAQQSPDVLWLLLWQMMYFWVASAIAMFFA